MARPQSSPKMKLMKFVKKHLPLFLIAMLSIESSAEMLRISINNERVGEFSVEQVKQLQKPRQIEVFEPHELRNRTYTAIPFMDLMDSVFKRNPKYINAWKKFDDVTFQCRDGYAATLDLAKVLRFNTYLAFGDAASSQFLITNTLQNNEVIKADPFYLIWDNIKSPELKKFGAYGWPYQIIEIGFMNFSDKYPKSAPRPDSGEEVRYGFRLFREKCISCHRIDGEGGEKGPELNHPVSVTEVMKEQWLKAWIKKPTAVRTGSTMPNYSGVDVDKEIHAIVSYLKYKAQK